MVVGRREGYGTWFEGRALHERRLELPADLGSKEGRLMEVR